MKKLLLLLMTLMFLAPPGAQAETKTIPIFQAYTADGSGGAQVRSFAIRRTTDVSNGSGLYVGSLGSPIEISVADGKNIYESCPTSYLVTIGSGASATKAVALIDNIKYDDITVEFDYSSCYAINATSASAKGVNARAANTSRATTNSIMTYYGTEFTIRLNQGLIDQGYVIRSIKFYQKATAAFVQQYAGNLLKGNSFLTEETYTWVDNATLCHVLTWNPTEGNETELKISCPKSFTYNGLNYDSSSMPNNANAQGYAVFKLDRVEVEYGIPPVAPKKPLLFMDGNIQIGNEEVVYFDSDSKPEFSFSKGSSDDSDDIKLHYKYVPKGTDEKDVNYTECGLNDVPAIGNTTGTLYWYASNPDDSELKSEVCKQDFRTYPQLSVFDTKGNIDGKLMIYSETNPSGAEYVSGSQHLNVSRMVFIPNDPELSGDAIIIEPDLSAGGASIMNVNQLWMFFKSPAKLNIRTQNGGKLMAVTFDHSQCAYTTDIFNKDISSDYIQYDDSFLNTSTYWSAIGKTSRTYKNASTKYTFNVSTLASSGNGGCNTLTIKYAPASSKTPDAPYANLALNGTGNYQGGIFRMYETLDVLINSTGGPVYYFSTTDPTQAIIPEQAKDKYHIIQHGEVLKVQKSWFGNSTSGRILIQSHLYTDQNVQSGVNQIFVEIIDATKFDKLSEIITTDNTGKEFTVTNSSPMQITGVYQTRLEGTTPGSTYYAYLVDSENHAIKLVSQGEVFPATYKEGTYLPAGGFIGDFRYNYGSPEIVVNESYRGFLQPAVEGTIDGYDTAVPDLDRINTTPTDAQPITDLNRHVRLRHLKWLTGNELEDPDGNRYLLYSCLVVPGAEDPTTLTGDIISAQAGTYWCIEGYVGQVNTKTAIFPTAKVLRCPDVPVLLAPNPVEGDIVAISKTVNVKVRAEEGVKYFYSIGEDKHTDTEMPADGLDLTDANFTDCKCSLYVYAYSTDGEIWSTEPAVVNITKHTALEVASIEDFKKPFFNEDGSEKSELFGRGELSDDAIDPSLGISRYYQLTGEAIIVKRTPYYLYLRDYKDGAVAGTLNSKNYLLVYNGNQWNEPKVDDGQGGTRELRAGDVITGVALSPDLTELGNLRSNTTGFARTVTLLQSVDSTIVKPIVKEVGYEDDTHDHYFSKVTVDNTNRMRYYTFEGVKVKHDDTTDEYTLDIATPVRMSFDIFSTRGGWVPAYSETGVYNITGVLIRDKQEGHFAIAPISFTGSGETPQPEVFLTENADTEKRADAVQEGGHTVRFKMDMNGAGTIYYSVDGNNPLDNQNSRRAYTAGEEITLTFAEGQDRAVVMAFAAEPGKTPSAVVTRTFIKTSRELNYLLNFINQGEQDRLYHFNGHVAVAAVGGKWMMVRGSVGHYLPIYNADAEWDVDAYKTGGYLTDFVIRYDKAKGNIRGIAEAGRIFPTATQDKDAAWDEITFAADSVMHISADNARRLVKLHSARVAADVAPAAEGDNASAHKWTVTGGDHEGAPHRLAVGILGDTEGAETLEDGSIYDITGFVMLDAEGNAELWPVKITKIAQTPRVSVKLNGQPLTPVSDTDFREYKASFSKGALVTLEVNDPRESVVIRYSYDDKTWYTYGEPFLVMESVEKIHAYAQAPGERASAHTHIQLTLKEASGSVEISSDNSTPGSATVTIVPAGTAKGDILYWTSKDSRKLPYTAPFTVNETMIVYAQLTADGKDDGAVSHSLVVVNPKNEEKPTEPTDPDEPTDPTDPDDPAKPEQPGDRVSGRVKFELTDDGNGAVKVKISPEQTLIGEYEIWYTTNTGVTLPEGGTLYTGAFDMTESGLVMAVLVEKGKPAGQTCEVTVWVIPTPTAIDSVGADGTGSVRVDGDSIIAPEGSEVYDVTGRRVRPEGLRNGIYIVCTPDGNAVKVAIR